MSRVAFALAIGVAQPALAAVDCARADVNYDCSVTVADVQLAVACALGTYAGPGCDVDGDGAISIRDAQAVVNALSPCGGVNTCLVCDSGDAWVSVGLGWKVRTLSAIAGEATVQAFHPNLPNTVTAALAPSLAYPWVQADSAPPWHVPVWVRLCGIDCDEMDCEAWWCASLYAPPGCD